MSSSDRAVTVTPLPQPVPAPPGFRRTGVLFVLSGPSGAGKTTLRAALRAEPGLVFSVSCTTRAPRPGEVDGEDYLFVTEEAFAGRVAAGEFLEHATVHGARYGTPRAFVAGRLAAGFDVLVEIDVQGAAAIRANAGAALGGALADVFITVAGREELRRRLGRRGTETAAALALRLRNAEVEMARWRDYRYVIVSGTPAADLENFRAVLGAERQASARLTARE